MWTIRQEQTEAFRQYHLKKFVDEMVEHLAKFSPQHYKVVGEPSMRQVIRLGMDNAGKYGFTDRGPVRFYVELMLMFGSYFDTDPQHPWATAVLNRTDLADQGVRADRLFDAMSRYCAQVVEPERERLIETLRRFKSAHIGEYLRPGINREEAMCRCALSSCPTRCQYLGELVVRRLVRAAIELASRLGFASDRGIALVVVLTFVAGHGFYKDPQYPWILQGLDSSRQPDPEKRLDDLCSKSYLYLEQVLAG
jgi:hypothetical protein